MTTDWQPPAHWQRITTIDAHTAGEPLRIIIDGLPPIPGDTILAKRRYAKENLDHLRTALMWEPRGHADMYGCIITEPTTPDGTLGVLFLHNEGWSTMCGHGVIGLVKVGIETGLLAAAPSPNPSQGEGDQTPSPLGRGLGRGAAAPSPSPSQREGDLAPSPLGRGLGRGDAAPVVRLDTPAGRVTAYPRFDADGRVTHVSFDNVPSYVVGLDRGVDVPGLGRVAYDLAFGGAYYAYVDAVSVGVGLAPADFRALIDLGTRIKQAVMAAGIPQHPFEPDLSLLYGVIFNGPAQTSEVAVGGQRPPLRSTRWREVCVFADGEVDRSPTGTGVSGLLALHYAKGLIGVGQPIVVESILGTTFTGEVVQATTFGPFPAVIPRVSGTAHLVGHSEWVIDPDDPLMTGFLLR